jgi:uncharacterized protein YegJ (DUF2314 family)
MNTIRGFLIGDIDSEMKEAIHRARESLPEFYAHCSRRGEHVCAARIRLPYPLQNELPAKPRYFTLWVTRVTYDVDSNRLSGEISELFPPTSDAYPVGLTLTWKPRDTHDWFVVDDGRVFGGFTLRAVRSRLSQPDQVRFDEQFGATSWAPAHP